MFTLWSHCASKIVAYPRFYPLVNARKVCHSLRAFYKIADVCWPCGLDHLQCCWHSAPKPDADKPGLFACVQSGRASAVSDTRRNSAPSFFLCCIFSDFIKKTTHNRLYQRNLVERILKFMWRNCHVISESRKKKTFTERASFRSPLWGKQNEKEDFAVGFWNPWYHHQTLRVRINITTHLVKTCPPFQLNVYGNLRKPSTVILLNQISYIRFAKKR
jgi:hypothetical protein